MRVKHLSAVAVLWWLAIAGCLQVVAQPILILGKDSNDQFLDAFWSQNNNASNLVAGVNANATIRFGTNVIEWDGVLGLIGLDGLSVPVPISAGGTGATTPAAARAALELANNLDADLYLGAITALSQDIGSASTSPGGWYGSGVVGTLTGPDPDIANVALGDVILSNGTNWMRYPAVQQVTTLTDLLLANAFQTVVTGSTATTNRVGTAMGTTSFGSALNASGYGATYYTNGLTAFNAIRIPALTQSTNPPIFQATNVHLLVGEYVEVGTSDYITNVVSTNFPWSSPWTNGYAVVRLPQTITPSTFCVRGSRLFVGYAVVNAANYKCDWILRSLDTVTSTNWDGNSYYASYGVPIPINTYWSDHTSDVYVPFEFDLIQASTPTTNFFLINGHLPAAVTNELHGATSDIDALGEEVVSMFSDAFDVVPVEATVVTNTVGPVITGYYAAPVAGGFMGYGQKYYTNGLTAFNAIRLPIVRQASPYTNALGCIHVVVADVPSGDYINGASYTLSTNQIRGQSWVWQSGASTNLVVRLTNMFTGLPVTLSAGNFTSNQIFVGWTGFKADRTIFADNMEGCRSDPQTNRTGQSFYNYMSYGVTNVFTWPPYSSDPSLPIEFAYIEQMPSTTNYFLPNGRLPAAITNELHAATANIEALSSSGVTPFGAWSLAMPPTIWGVVGLEAHCYWAGLCPADWRDWLWEATATTNGGTTYTEDWRHTPSVAGTLALAVSRHSRMSTNWTAEAEATNVVVTAAADAAGSATLVAIGDSTTDGAAWLIPLAANDAADAYFDVTSIGTRLSSGIYHEGRGGWSATTYTSAASTTGITNAFWNGSGFSMNFWLTNNSFADPTHVVIKLGINDLFGAATDAAADTMIATHLGHMATIVNNITNTVSAVKVGICLVEPTSRDQDGYGANYGSGQNGWRARRNYWKLNHALIAIYAGRTAQRLYLLPTNVCIDDWYGYSLSSVPVNSRVATTISRQSNGVHPGTDGKEQIADCIWAWLKNNP